MHTHSTASDGSLTPSELVRQADACRLAVIALTDHDTTEGLAEARQAARDLRDLKFVAGVEISARYAAGTLHILGLGIDETCHELVSTLRGLRRARRQRNPKIIARLKELGIDVTMADVMEVVGETGAAAAERVVGRLHIAEAMRRKGYVSSLDEAFAKFIGSKCPAYVDKERLAPRRAIRAIRSAGGLAVLAHPVHLGCPNIAQLERVVRELVSGGIQAIEVYHSDHTPEQAKFYADLAARGGLAVTGGSDYHGKAKPGVALGQPRVAFCQVFANPLARRLLGKL